MGKRWQWGSTQQVFPKAGAAQDSLFDLGVVQMLVEAAQPCAIPLFAASIQMFRRNICAQVMNLNISKPKIQEHCFALWKLGGSTT